MRSRVDSFRRMSLLIMISFLLGVRPSNAQTRETSSAAGYVGQGNEVIPDHESGEVPEGIAKDQRLKWFIESTIGPRSLLAGIASAGIETGLNRPREYGVTGHGFDRRYEMRLAGVSAGNAMEATLGAIWREDPRYRRAPNEPLASRVRNVVKMTFVAYRSDGNLSPAYARYIGIAGSNFLANSWRAHEEANLHNAVLRTCVGFLARMASNTVQEFWPDVKRRILRE